MKKVDVLDEALQEEGDATSADLIITLTDRLRVLVFRSKKEYLLQELIRRTSRGKGKLAEGVKYENWMARGSFGNVEQCLVLAVRLAAELKCVDKREIELKEFLKAQRSCNAELKEIIKGI